MKALIAITTCNRLSEVKKFIWEYIKFVNGENQFDFVLGLDGKNQEYIDFAEKYDIPLIYSEEREGVGLSKNRLLSYFPNYDYYFFIEDDIELVEQKIFKTIILAHEKTGVPHFCNHHKSRIFNTIQLDNLQLEVSWTGGAQFAFYSKKGIGKIGGFNTIFAKYKRFGHTEHSYRYYHQGIQEGPFIFSENWLDYFIIHSPPQVTRSSSVTFTKLGLIEQEQSLIDRKSTFFELKTLSNSHFNKKALGYNKIVANFLETHQEKYPLTYGRERRIALAEHYALRISIQKSALKKFTLFLKSFWYSPTNAALKHYIKTDLIGRK